MLKKDEVTQLMKKINKILIIFIALMSVVACGTVESPEKAVVKAFNAVAKQDESQIERYFVKTGFALIKTDQDPYTYEFQKLLLKQLTTKVISAEIENGKAVVETDVTNIDLDKVMHEYKKESLKYVEKYQGDKLEEKLENNLFKLLKKKGNNKTTTIQVTLILEGNQWRIQPDENLIKAMMPGADKV